MSEGIYELHGNAQERARVLEEATDRAKQKAIDAGAAPEGCQVCTQPYHMCMTCRRILPELTCGIAVSM